MGVTQKVTRKLIHVVWGGYGALSGVIVQPRGRLWILADGPELDAVMTARAAWNRPKGGVEYADLGPVSAVTVRRGNHLHVRLANTGATIDLVSASCVCGAGAVGNALPEPGRLAITNVSLYGRENVTIL